MKRLYPEQDWPESWQASYEFDLEEVYEQGSNRGYAYAYEVRRDKTLALIEAALPPGARILDIAAAQGNFSLALAEKGYLVTWNDLRSELQGYVEKKYQRGAIEYAPGNAFELQFESPFDAVLITEVIEHVAYPDEFLRKTAELVRPDGHVVMTTPNGAYFRNTLPRFSDCADPTIYESVQFQPDGDGHIFLLFPDEVRSLAAHAGLVIDEVLYFTNPLTNGHMKSSYLLRLLPKRWVLGVEALLQKLPAPLNRSLHIQVGVRFRKPAA